jgi:hypothetical protein
MIVVFLIRLHLVRENKVREQEIQDDGYEDVYISKVVDGEQVEFKVHKVSVFLPLCSST